MSQKLYLLIVKHEDSEHRYYFDDLTEAEKMIGRALRSPKVRSFNLEKATVQESLVEYVCNKFLSRDDD